MLLEKMLRCLLNCHLIRKFRMQMLIVKTGNEIMVPLILCQTRVFQIDLSPGRVSLLRRQSLIATLQDFYIF